jgi:hypothetical protein
MDSDGLRRGIVAQGRCNDPSQLPKPRVTGVEECSKEFKARAREVAHHVVDRPIVLHVANVNAVGKCEPTSPDVLWRLIVQYSVRPDLTKLVDSAEDVVAAKL